MAISFATAKTVKTATKATKAEKVGIVMEGLEELAALDAMIKSMTSLKATLEETVKQNMANHFVKEGLAIKARPANFKGVEGMASASCELRSRSTASGLSDEEQVVLKLGSIPMTTVSSVVDTFIVNPAYAADSKMLEAVAKKLNTIKDIPDDFIMKQDGVSKTIIAEGAMDAVFNGSKKRDPEVAMTLMRIVGTLAIKPKFEDAKEAFKIVNKMFN